jgi:hypothetical protein
MLVLSVVGTSVLCLTSCGREKQPTIEKSYTIELTENQEYSFVLPDDKRKDPYQFTVQGAHYSSSVVTKNASSEQVFQYVPASGYHGMDQVVVTNANENGEHSCGNNGGSNFGQCCGNGGGGCFNHSEDDHYKITFNFVIRTASSTSDVK